MVKHIVLYTFKEGVNKEEAVQIVAEALAAYAVHPLHEEAKAKFFHLLDKRYAADYEY